jgi:hypothetical protein
LPNRKFQKLAGISPTNWMKLYGGEIQVVKDFDMKIKEGELDLKLLPQRLKYHYV